MRNKILTTLMIFMLASGILGIFNIARAVDVTLTLSDAELSTQFGPTWGPGVITLITDILGPGVRFDFNGLGGSGTGVSDGYPVSQLAGGAPDSVGGWGNFQAYTQYRLVFTNLGPNPISVNTFMNTGWTNVVWQKDTYWEDGWIGLGVGQSQVVTLDFSSAICWNAQDDPIPAWQYLGGTAGVVVRRLNEVSRIGFQVCGNGPGSIVVSSTTPADTVVSLPDEELSTQFAKEYGPGTLASVMDLAGLGVRFDFTGLDGSTGTVVGDNFAVSALAGGAWKDYGSGFAGPYDFSGYARYSLLFINIGTTPVTVNLKMNTGWTNAPWGNAQRDTFWQDTWTQVPAGESRIVTLDFWSAEVWHATDDPNPSWQYPDGTKGVAVRRLDEVSDIGFQILGSGAASVIVSGETILALSDGEMSTQFAKETGPGTLTTVTDVPGSGVKFDFTGLNSMSGTVIGDSFAVSRLAGGAYKTYGVLNPFSTWGDFFAYTKYRMIFTNVGSTSVTVNLKMNTGWTIVPPEYAAAWRDTFWQNTWTSVAPGESKVVTLDFSSAEVWHATDEQEYPVKPDGTTGVAVWRLDEVSDIGFQILGSGAASIIVAARPQAPEVYVDDGYTSSTLGWGYDHFDKIQDGVDAVAAGGIVHVYDGIYVENVNINKAITLKSESRPIIDGNGAGACITIGANGVTVNGFELINGYYGIASWGTDASVISDNIIHDILNIPGYAGCGIMFWSDSDDFDNNRIDHNTIYDCDRQGIYIGGETFSFISEGNTISYNTIYNNGKYTYANGPDASAYGIQLSFADHNTIDNNEIYGHDDWFPWPDWYPTYDFAQGIYLYDSSHNAITNNYLHGNNYGVGIWHGTRTVETNYINYNNIAGNTGYGVITYDGTPVVDGRFNWWGSATGPTHSSNTGGVGDAISDNVDYSPWLGFVVGTSPMAYHVNPSGGSDAIQEAVDEASDGDTVKAHAGTYYENQITIGKSLAVIGSGASTTIIDGGGVLLSEVGLVRITTATGDVTFSGFTLRNAGGPEVDKGYGTFKVRVGIYASSASSGPTYTISSNWIYGTNNDVEEEDYGFYTYGGKDDLIFSINMITQTGANAILIERHTGPIDLGYNTIDVGCYGCDGIFSMTYGGDDITTLQKIHDNTIDVGTGGPYDYDHRATGITFASSFGGGSLGYGKFTNVQISKNTITNIKNYRRGIGLWDAGGGGGGGIVAPVITGNNVIGPGGTTGSFGIRLLGLVGNAMITSNEISGCAAGILINDTATATIRYNEVKNNDAGIVIDSDNCIIERNRILGNTGPFSGIHLTSIADGNEIHYNCIVGNTGTNVYGIYKEGGSTVNATLNWWGDSTGPYHPTKNPLGLGNKASDYVLFDPWLKAYFDYAPHHPEINQPVTFDASLSTTPCNTKTIVSYTWNFDDGNTTTTANPVIVHAFTAEGDYHVALTLTYDDATTNQLTAQVHVSKVPYFKVEPATLDVKLRGSVFQVNVTLNDLDVNLQTVAVQFRLCYNSTLLEFVNITEGPFLSSFAAHGTFFSYILFEIDPRFGSNVIVGVLILPNATGYWNPPFPSGSGTIATINFKAIYQERGLEKPPLSCGLNLAATIILDSDGLETPHTVQNGAFKMWPTHLCDINYDGLVDVIDYYRVTRAFGTASGTTPVYPRWDPLADLNFDQIVDVSDIYIIARAYGWIQDPDP